MIDILLVAILAIFFYSLELYEGFNQFRLNLSEVL